MREPTPEPRPTNCTRAAAEKEKKKFYSESNLRGKAPTDYQSIAIAARPGGHVHAGVKCTNYIYRVCNFSSSSGVALGSKLLVSQWIFCVFKPHRWCLNYVSFIFTLYNACLNYIHTACSIIGLHVLLFLTVSAYIQYIYYIVQIL